MSRTSWRGIFFSFNGRYSSFFRIYLGYFFLTLFTIGLGYPWLKVALQKKLFSHTSLGNMQMRFTGDGGTLFGINLLGYFLSYLTLGIYAPKWIKERLKFTVENTHLMDDYHSGSLTCHLRYGQAFEILFSNLLLLIFTVGLAYPFTHMRYLKMIFSNIELPAELNYDNIQQVAASRAEATGDQLFDILDLDIDF
jgi:Predicted membrane protein